MMPPLIITAFANPEGNAKLDFLEKEETDIRELFYPTVNKNRLSHASIGHTTSDNIFKAFTKLQARINIFHYGGHANNFGVELLNGQYKLRQFAEILKGSRPIELVFLNGCSTVGLVDTFLNAGVKAVIATDRRVDDRNASKFAIDFYDGFLMEGRTLEDAFYNATANQANWEDSEKIIYRDNNFGEIVEDDSSIPWGLHLHKEHARRILDWQLIEKDSSDSDVEIGGMWKERYEDYNRLKADEAILAQKLIKQIATQKKLLRLATIDNDLEEVKNVQQQIKLLEKDLENNGEESNLALVALSELSAKNYKEAQKISLQAALHNLNFTNEISTFNNIYFNKQNQIKVDIGAFIVQGSTKCGLFLLKKRIINIAFPTKREQKIFTFNFRQKGKSLIPTKAGIWSDLMRRMKIEGENTEISENLDERQQYNLLKKVFEKHLKLGDLILVFENLEEVPPPRNNELIRDFWFTFSKQVRKYKNELAAKGQDVPNNKILAFFIDNKCHPGAADKRIIPNRDYTQYFSKMEENEYNIFVLTFPEKVNRIGLKNWYTHSNLPLQIDYNAILDEFGDYVLPTIEKVCESTGIFQYYECFPPYSSSEL